MSEPYVANFELAGTTPFLMHADDVEAADTLKAWRSDPANKNISVPGDDRSPPWTWMTYLYSDGKNLSVPSANLMTCLRTAGTKKIMKRQTTFKEITQSGMFVESEHLEFYNGGKTIKLADATAIRNATAFSDHILHARKFGFELYSKRAVIGKAKHVRTRPRFDRWSIRGSISVFAQEITKEVLSDIFRIAGNVGLGDWRPGCRTPGPFGMFTAKLSF